MSSQLCVVIPCAGKGRRLGTPYPKELMCLEQKKSVIDYSFDLLKNYNGSLRIIIVISQEHLDTVDYLSKYSDTFEIVFQFQKSSLHELYGALMSAKGLFSKYNLLLFPDSILIPNGSPLQLLEDTMTLLDKGKPVFWTKSEYDPSVFIREGALKTEPHDSQLIVIDGMEKPTCEFDKYNAIWGAMAFAGSNAEECLAAMAQVQRGASIADIPVLSHAFALKIKAFYDLGTWEGIHSFYSKIIASKLPSS